MDELRLRPFNSTVEAVVAVPGSKSIANRALVCAALATGESVLSNVPDGDDTRAMIAGLSELGVTVSHDGDRAALFGVDPTLFPDASIDARLAGTTSRFLTALAALGSLPITIDGAPGLRRRPFGPLHEALAQLGVALAPAGAAGQLPVTVQGPPRSGSVTISGDVSSQYITALMLIGPYLPGGLTLELTSPLVSRPYVEMTAAVIASFMVDDVQITQRSVTVGAGTYSGTQLAIEPDASSASYPLAIAAVRGGSLTITGLGAGSLQGDALFAQLMARMGCRVDVQRSATTVARDVSQALHGIDVDMADISDLVPTLAAVALFAETPTRIRGVGFIRRKESDRLGDLARELRALGGDVEEADDGLSIVPSTEPLHGADLATHHDHRLAMAFGVVGTVVDGVVVGNPDVVSKSWPGYWAMLDEIRP